MPTCFVIQPFDRENDERYEEVFKPALREAGVEPYRVDQDPGVDVPIAAIEDGIRKADICFADITTNNPNVWYELGFAFASLRPVVMVCAKARAEKLPFDIRHRAPLSFMRLDHPDTSRGFTKRSSNGLRRGSPKRAHPLTVRYPPRPRSCRARHGRSLRLPPKAMDTSCTPRTSGRPVQLFKLVANQ